MSKMGSKYSVYFGDQEGKFHALDAADGRELWTFSTAGEIVSSANYGNGSLVFGSYDGFIYCLNAKDGSLRWKFETAGRVHGTPAVVDDAVIAAGCDEFLHVISLADGSSQQKVSMGSVSGASVPVNGAMAIVGTYGNSVLGVNWKEAKVAWTFADPEREFPFMSSAALTSGAAFIGGRDKRVRSLNPGTGAVNWTFATDGKVESSPVIVGDRVFFGSGDGNLYALDAAKGTELWRYEAGAPISASLAVAAEKLVIGTEDGVLYCFGQK
jgi:outer membrane protein assembly factor BamB